VERAFYRALKALGDPPQISQNEPNSPVGQDDMGRDSVGRLGPQAGTPCPSPASGSGSARPRPANGDLLVPPSAPGRTPVGRLGPQAGTSGSARPRRESRPHFFDGMSFSPASPRVPPGRTRPDPVTARRSCFQAGRASC
jgi:hypothetical protein